MAVLEHRRKAKKEKIKRQAAAPVKATAPVKTAAPAKATAPAARAKK